MSTALFDRVRRIAEDVFEVPSGQMTTSSSSENIENWDSVRHLNLVLALEQEFSLQFEPEEIDEMTEVGAIVAVLGRKLKTESKELQ